MTSSSIITAYVSKTPYNGQQKEEDTTLQASGINKISTRTKTVGHLTRTRDRLNSLVQSPSIEFLTNQETQQLEKTLLEYEACNRSEYNILEILQSLPDELSKKLKVIIATHEGNYYIRYFKQLCSTHVFILGNTEHGLTMFDPIIPESNSMPVKNWNNAVYQTRSIEYPLTNTHTLKYLPQFKIIEANHYINEYNDVLKFIIDCPEDILKNETKILNSKFWKNSYSINLYEMNQLCLGNATYEETMNHHQHNQSPLTRLNDEQIDYLRAFHEK